MNTLSARYGIERITFVDPNPDVASALGLHFADEPGCEVRCARFETLDQFDCMVSAANSFGLMDGGVDLAIVNYFGLELMDRVQQHILSHYFGEQPVGTCFLVETGDEEHPFVAHAPTMRVPADIRGTDNVYCAMLAVLQAVARHNLSGGHIRHIACPGLGTLTGRMSPGEAARQMQTACLSMRFPMESMNWPAAAVRASNVRPRQ